MSGLHPQDESSAAGRLVPPGFQFFILNPSTPRQILDSGFEMQERDTTAADDDSARRRQPSNLPPSLLYTNSLGCKDQRTCCGN